MRSRFRIPPVNASRSVLASLAILIGCGSVVAGHAPWLLSGQRLPLQNLWASDTLPGDMPWSPLPLSQYLFEDIFGILAGGTALAALAVGIANIFVEKIPRHLTLGCVVVGQMASITWASNTLYVGLQPTSLARLYWVGITGVTLLLATVGWVGFSLVQQRVPTIRACGLLLLIIPLGHLWDVYTSGGSFLTDYSKNGQLPWIAIVLIGLFLALHGIERGLDKGVWLICLIGYPLMVCIGQALNYAAASARYHRGDIPAMIAHGIKSAVSSVPMLAIAMMYAAALGGALWLVLDKTLPRPLDE